MGIWNRQYECISTDELSQLKLERLQATVNRAYERVAFYRRTFDKAGITPQELRSPDHLSQLPFTTREDLCNGYPYDMFAVSLRDVVRIHSSSGMRKGCTVCGYTLKDLNTWSELTARALSAAGIDADDVIQVYFGHGLFASGFGFQYGAERVGASVVPVHDDNPDRQTSVMRDYRVTSIIGTASYILSIAEHLKEASLNPRVLSLRVGLIGGEPWSERVRSEIENRLEIKTYDNYGLSELGGSGVSWECECRSGLHISEDHFLAEVVNPATGEPLPYGSEGELVLTTLTREALPLIRYRTGDLTTLTNGLCECGRTLARMSRVHSRTDDMVIVQGRSIYPSQIGDIIESIGGANPHYRIIIDREGASDTLEVQIEVSENIFGDTVSQLVQIEDRIASEIQSKLGVSPVIKLVESRTIQRTPGNDKQRVFDKREL